MISDFRGKYAFLSNYFTAEVELDGEKYPTIEHAFQAAKTTSPDERKKILACGSPAEARKTGRRVQLRPDWESIKIDVMRQLVRQKFTKNALLRKQLIDTGLQELVEENTWGDTFWGMVDGEGSNHLGEILMDVREELKRK